jgi:cytochrome P450
MTIVDRDLARPSLFREGRAHEAFRYLRAHDPVSWHDAVSEGDARIPGFWSVVKYEDVLAVSRDTATFSSARGINMYVDPENPSPSSGAGRMIIAMDPPRHVRLRRLVNRGFTPRMVAQLEPRIRAITTGILDEVAPRGRCDFVLDVAAPLPLAVICEMMGVARADWRLMFDATNQVLGAGDEEYQTEERDRVQTVEHGRRALFGHFARLLAERRQQPGQDLVSTLAGAEVDEEPLTDEEILYFCYLLILAGNETTRNAISGGVLALAEHADQRARLIADPALLTTAIEEILRWTSPVLHMARVATRACELRGRSIERGQKVVMWYPSANRDEDVFPQPDRFDVERQPNEHLAFGHGEHFCLGASLARLELRVMFEELLRRMPDLALTGPAERLHSTFIGGIKHMPVEFTAS